MGTTAQKLKKLLDNKRAIRDAITEKTGEDAGEVMSTYADKILAIEGDGTKYFRTTILLDQTVTDPATMIMKVYDDGGINQIRLNSHRYVCKLVDGVMQAKQLQDNNGTLYLDGTTADLTGAEGDVMMKLPEFYYRARSEETDKWFIDFVYGERPDESYKVWDGKDFIGAYEAYVADSNVYSRSGVVSTGSVSQANFKTYASNRGEGYTLVKWKHHCIMAFLFYAEYLNTHSQATCGKGTDSYTKVSGQTDLLGMEDTAQGVNGNSQSINFFGLENWWGNKYEFVDNVVVDKDVLDSGWLIEEDGVQRVAGNTFKSDSYIKKLVLGEYLDAIPSESGGSGSSGYCDYFWYPRSTNRVILRSGYINESQGGITAINATFSSEQVGSDVSSRLAYRGEYETFDGVFDAEYAEIDAFDNNGTGWFNTGFAPNQNTRLVMDFELFNEVSAAKALFGERNSTQDQNLFSVWIWDGNQFRTDFGSSANNYYLDVPSIVGRFVLDKNRNTTTINSYSVTTTAESWSTTYPIYLFSNNYNNTPDTRVPKVRLYSCQIYDNDTLVRDYVPCVRKSDGERGLWDKVNKTFNTPITIA